jgi:hypothetical protein
MSVQGMTRKTQLQRGQLPKFLRSSLVQHTLLSTVWLWREFAERQLLALASPTESPFTPSLANRLPQ